jgi:thioredoxin-like negative regulator of GroEL
MVFTRTARNLWRRATARVVSQQFAKDEYGWVTITAANFQDVVIRDKRDVLIEFYTPLV